MNRRDFIKAVASCAALPLVVAVEPLKTLKSGFKYLGGGVYSYDLPTWVDSTGKWHYMNTSHSIHLLPGDVGNRDLVRKLRIQTACQHREGHQRHEKSDLVVVMYEDNLRGEIENPNNCLYRPGAPPEFKRVWNHSRFFLMDRKTFEAEVVT